MSGKWTNIKPYPMTIGDHIYRLERDGYAWRASWHFEDSADDYRLFASEEAARNWLEEWQSKLTKEHDMNDLATDYAFNASDEQPDTEMDKLVQELIAENATLRAEAEGVDLLKISYDKMVYNRDWWQEQHAELVAQRDELIAANELYKDNQISLSGQVAELILRAEVLRQQLDHTRKDRESLQEIIAESGKVANDES